MEENKPEKITRIYAQNLNGLKWNKDGGNWPQVCNTITAIHADIACFTELNQDINTYAISNKMRQIESQFCQHSKFAGSTSTNKIKCTYKPGGTGMLVVEDTTGYTMIHKR